jgi:hypothetical protein
MDAPKVGEPVTTVAVLEYQVREQKGFLLRTAAELRDDLRELVEQLQRDSIPSSSPVNVNTVLHLIQAHTKLLTLEDALRLARDLK